MDLTGGVVRVRKDPLSLEQRRTMYAWGREKMEGKLSVGKKKVIEDEFTWV